MAKKYYKSHRHDFYGWLAIGFVMVFFSWGIFVYFQPVIAETNCSEMASRAASISSGENLKSVTNSDYGSIKAKCMEELNNKNFLLSLKK